MGSVLSVLFLSLFLFLFLFLFVLFAALAPAIHLRRDHGRAERRDARRDRDAPGEELASLGSEETPEEEEEEEEEEDEHGL